MIQSAPTLPIRFYNDLFDQDRFNKFHKREKDTQLFFPANELPSFQINTSSTLSSIPSSFTLRKVCNEVNYGKLIPESASNFENAAAISFFGSFPKGASGIYDDGVNPSIGCINCVPVADLDVCGRLVTADYFNSTFVGTTFAELVIPTVSNVKHKFEILVEEFQNFSGNFQILIYKGGSGGTIVGTIDGPGHYTFDFTSSTDITIQFFNFDVGDSFAISHIQAAESVPSSLTITDVDLDENDIQYFQKTDGGDILVWCDNSQNYIVEEGDYYFIVECDEEIFYSEIFTVKKLNKLKNYYILNWWNTCDLNGIIFNSGVLPCNFKNKLYLDAALFKPEYNTVSEGEQNGENTVIATFKKWQKSLSLELIKCPEFLADSLSAVFLHDSIYLTDPVQREQMNRNESKEIIEVASDITPALEDSFQRVVLKLLLSDSAIKSNCCENISLIASS